MNREQQSQLEHLLDEYIQASSRVLDLSAAMLDFPLGEEGCEIVARRAGELGEVEELNLAGAEIRAGGLRAVMSMGQALGRLKKLELRGCDLCRSGMAELAAGVAQFPLLEELGLRSADVGPSGLRLLQGRLRPLRSLHTLDLSNNDLGDEGAEVLGGLAPDLGTLRALLFAFNEVGTPGAEAQTKASRHWPSLALLHLAGNMIDDAGAESLAQVSWPALAELCLHMNRIGSRGVSAIAAASRQWPMLHHLDLDNNSADDDGAMAVLDALRREPWRSSLQYLKLDSGLAAMVPIELLGTTDASTWRSYADELARGGVQLNEVKLLLLGEGRVGKSHLRERLFGDDATYFNPGELPTHDIETMRWRASVRDDEAKRQITVSVWDFGGQQMLHATHRLFLSDRRGLFVIVCDATRTRRQNRLDYWLHLVRFEASMHSPIIIVVTKCDLFDNAGEELLERRLEPLDVRELRAAAGLPESTPLVIVDGLGWSPRAEATGDQRAQHAAALARLRDAVEEAIPHVPDIDTRYPASLIHLMRWMRTGCFSGEDGALRGWVPKDRIREAARRCAVPNELFGIALDIGYSIGLVHFAAARRTLRAGERLDEIVFNPEWVKTPAYRLIREGGSDSSRGVLSWEAIESLLPAHPANPHGVTLWERLEFTPSDRVNVVDLMIACELLFLMDRGSRTPRYFVPDHLPPRRASGPPSGKYAWRRDFDWLPETEFGRLIGRLHQQGLDGQDALWRDEITISVGRRGQMTVRLAEMAPPAPSASSRRTSNSTIYVAISGSTEHEALRLLDQLDAELRSIRSEALVGPTAWTEVEGRPRKRADKGATPGPNFAQYAVRIYTSVKDVADRGGCEVESWADLLKWADRIVQARAREGEVDAELAAAVTLAKAEPERFYSYCRRARCLAWWSDRGKTKMSRSATDWAAEDVGGRSAGDED